MAIDASTLTIVHYPHPALREKARPVESVTPEVRAVALRMIKLMQEAEGIGLAAPQVGLPWRLFVVHVPEDPEEERSASADPATATLLPTVYINPVITDPSGPVEPYEEGCLSLPNITGEVLRPPVVTITATDPEGNRFTHRAGGLLARCFQHELDHLDGVLILDRMSQVSRLKARRAIKDLERSAL